MLKASGKTGEIISYLDGNVWRHSNHRQHEDGAGFVEGVDFTTTIPGERHEARSVCANSHLNVGGSHLFLAPKDDVLLLVTHDDEALEQAVSVDECSVGSRQVIGHRECLVMADSTHSPNTCQRQQPA